MQLTVDRDQLIQQLDVVMGAVAKRPAQTILGHVHIKADDGELELTASDLELELSSRGRCQTQLAGSTTVPARKLLEIAKGLSEHATLALHTQGWRAMFSSGSSRFTLATLPASDMPLANANSVDGQLTCTAKKFAHLLLRTQYAAARNDLRGYLCGVCLEPADGTLAAVATDGRRLAYDRATVTDAIAPAQLPILPNKAVAELTRLLKDAEGDAVIAFGNGQMKLTCQRVACVVKLIEGTFPEYGGLLAAPARPNVAIVDRDELTRALRAAIVLADTQTSVTLGVGEQIITIRATNAEDESAYEAVEAGYSGEPLAAIFNGDYMLQALAAVGTTNVELAFGHAQGSCAIRDCDDGNSMHVVSPLREAPGAALEPSEVDV